MNIVTCFDLESTMSKVAFSLAFQTKRIGHEVYNKPVENGRKTRSGKTQLVSVNTEICENIVNVNIYFTDVTHTDEENVNINKKKLLDMESCKHNSFNRMLFMKFNEGVKCMIDAAADNILTSHCLINDFAILLATQNNVIKNGGDKKNIIVNDNILTIPKLGVNDERWKKITFLCSRELAILRCPNFMKIYKEQAPTTESKKFISTTLEELLKFVKSPEYKQSHIASQDTEDLWTLIKHMYQSDGDIIFAKYDSISCCTFDKIKIKLEEKLQSEEQKKYIIYLTLNKKKLTSELTELLNNPNRTVTQASALIEGLKLLRST